MQAAKQTHSTPETTNSGEIKNISEQQDSIKVTKNSKGYTWEVKRYYDFSKKKPEEVISEIESIDKELQKKFGELV